MIADAQKVKGLAPLACKTDRIDAWVLAELVAPRSRAGDLAARSAGARRARAGALPAAPGPPPHQPQAAASTPTLIAFGNPCPVSDLFGVAGRELLERLEAAAAVAAQRSTPACELIDDLERRDRRAASASCGRLGADHPYVPLLLTVPGIGWVLAYTIAAEIGDIDRFATPRKLAGYTGLCPRVLPVRRPRPAAARSPRTAPATCAGRSLEADHARAARTPSTATATSAPSAASASSAAPRSPRSTSPAGSPKRSGTCSPATNPSLRQAPLTPSGRLTALGVAPPERTPIRPGPPTEEAIER